MGYAIALHIRYTTPTFLFQTYPAAWTEFYSENGLVLQDPALRWGFSNTGHTTWESLAEDDVMGVFKNASKHGLKHGVVMALERDGSRSVASFARDDRPFTEAEIATIETAVTELHDRTLKADSLPAVEQAELKKLSQILS